MKRFYSSIFGIALLVFGAFVLFDAIVMFVIVGISRYYVQVAIGAFVVIAIFVAYRVIRNRLARKAFF
ncbi:hypothetical protein [Naasia lichenicola]|uniref:Uncharacterized protein n=1 Tax=Naasia lichenicola TaxID=2565933 RepID=A0A4S4FN77_9MICO|nr:hypothetical protein [Naasia lichenicola]THG30662.1 hypothetical protein E6C64_08460 [Naasia lichenicola]THG31899.1 hypothetical protein E6C64_07605 [Naasia lichenicola]